MPRRQDEKRLIKSTKGGLLLSRPRYRFRINAEIPQIRGSTSVEIDFTLAFKQFTGGPAPVWLGAPRCWPPALLAPHFCCATPSPSHSWFKAVTGAHPLACVPTSSQEEGPKVGTLAPGEGTAWKSQIDTQPLRCPRPVSGPQRSFRGAWERGSPSHANPGCSTVNTLTTLQGSCED